MEGYKKDRRNPYVKGLALFTALGMLFVMFSGCSSNNAATVNNAQKAGTTEQAATQADTANSETTAASTATSQQVSNKDQNASSSQTTSASIVPGSGTDGAKVSQDDTVLKQGDKEIFKAMSNVQKKELNTFFSNFSEVYVDDFDISNYKDEDLIFFAIIHSIANFRDRIKFENNRMFIDQAYIDKDINRFFGVKVKHKSVYDFTYSSGRYTWRPADGEQYNHFCHVAGFYENGDGTFSAKINVYEVAPDSDWGDTIYDPNTAVGEKSNGRYPSVGRAEAVVKRYNMNGKETYQLIKYHFTKN